jgi:hypothetical protein
MWFEQTYIPIEDQDIIHIALLATCNNSSWNLRKPCNYSSRYSQYYVRCLVLRIYLQRRPGKQERILMYKLKINISLVLSKSQCSIYVCYNDTTFAMITETMWSNSSHVIRVAISGTSSVWLSDYLCVFEKLLYFSWIVFCLFDTFCISALAYSTKVYQI